jgi:hypothetical protein
MRRFRGLTAIAATTIALALSACGGDDAETTTGSPTPGDTGGATAPSPGVLPPEVVQCFEDRGFDLESPTEIHSAPQQVVQACFGALHQGSGTGG